MGKENRKTKGEKGENAVLGRYIKEKYKLLEKNWRAPIGEIDLIFQKKNTLVFVEVKTATGGEFGSPLEKIDSRKQKKLAQLADLYLATHSSILRKIRNVRIDGAAVLMKDDNYEITIAENIIEL